MEDLPPQSGPRPDRSAGNRIDSGTDLPVQGVCCQPSGEGAVQQRNKQVCCPAGVDLVVS